ncbi:hypothetical protein OXB_0179 [Bacillus sp. OxB-1]|uniref:IS66 family insertion sequence element accessory protein TnpA n=1 Tax=Bacillus sp. (strain OxB-1) TaxID=98228 RepID=UPI0005822414|nr:hypothetical protein [Bacillus sp. OxB-1]BAQ08651.1 hypothetical protein OXB_0179 [Bacillus sp. OxB-1]
METDTPLQEIQGSGKEEEWIRLIDEWRESGQSIKDWVHEKEDITYKQFLYWRKQLFPDEIEKRPVEMKETVWSSLNVEIPSATLDVFVHDCRIEVTTGFDQELFREIVEVLRNAN